MPNFPDEIPIEKNKDLQTNLYVIAFLIGLGGVIALFNGEGKGVFAMMLGYVIGWIASKIKTSKKFQGGASIYK